MSYDSHTVALLRTVVDEAWTSLSPQQQRTTYVSALASRVLECASQGERDPIRLREAALGGPEL